MFTVFIFSTVFLLLFGIFQLLTGSLSYHATSPIGQTVPSLSIILILRAFTSGSASLTGVEAISNAVPFFKTPKEKNAAQTLTIMSLILGFLFAGITFLNYWMGITPQHGETILSQMAKGILGDSALGQIVYYLFQFSTALILAVAANTGFSAFPMLAYNMAKNKYKAVIGPGTGLGVSGLVHSAAGWVALAGEGGHTSFPPFDDMEVLIWQYAKNKYGHVSAERFLSGSGLSLIYETLAKRDNIKQCRLKPSEITDKALSGTSPICRQTLDIFCAMLGTVASNLALTLGARGGVYLCGGIIPRVLDYFKTSPFRSRFENKGRFEAYLAAIPVYVVLSEFPGIVGAAVALDNHLNNV